MSDVGKIVSRSYESLAEVVATWGRQAGNNNLLYHRSNAQITWNNRTLGVDQAYKLIMLKRMFPRDFLCSRLPDHGDLVCLSTMRQGSGHF